MPGSLAPGSPQPIQLYLKFMVYWFAMAEMARWYGFVLPPSFLNPYAASGYSDFWRRWNVHPGRWMADYVYRPLGGAHRGRYRNLLLVMGFSGLWHGPEMYNLLWGAVEGIKLVVERWLHARRILPLPGPRPLVHAAAVAFTFQLQALSWLLLYPSSWQIDDIHWIANVLAKLF